MRIILPVFTVTLLLLAPILIAYRYIGPQLFFNFFAGDSMYYLEIANNFNRFGIPTFDGNGPTNGFQPLWELVLIALFKLTMVNHHSQIYIAFLAGLLFVYAAYVMFSITFTRMLGLWPGLLATLSLFPGGYALLFEPRRHFFNDPGMLGTLNPHSAINGMETSLSLALWSLFFLILVTRFLRLQQAQAHDHAHPLAAFFPFTANLCLALIILTRLDDFCVAIAIALFVFCQTDYSLRERIRTLVHIAWPSMIAIGLYILYNLHTLGLIIPVSVMIKTSAISGDHYYYKHIAKGKGLPLDPQWWNGAVRLYPLLFSYIAGILFIVRGKRRSSIRAALTSDTFSFMLVLFGSFLIVKATFLLKAVGLFHQGYWYYFSMITIVNVIIAFTIGYLCRKYAIVPLGLFVCVAIVLLRVPNDINFMTASSDTDTYTSRDFNHPVQNANVYLTDSSASYGLWVYGEEIRAFLEQKAPSARMIDNYDGMFGYLLDMPSQSTTGLASGPKEMLRRQSMGFWQAMIGKGTALIPSYGYYDPRTIPKDLQILERLQPAFEPMAFYLVKVNDGSK